MEVANRSRSSRSNLVVGTVEGILATPFVILTAPGSFVLVALLSEYFQLDKAALGWIVSLPSWSNAAQVVVIPLLARFLTAKDMTIGLGWFNAGLWAMLVLALPYLPRGQAGAVAVFFTGFFLMASPSQAFFGIGWTTWLRDWVPQRLRGGYVGSRNRWMSVATIAYLLFIMGLFELGQDALWPFIVMIGVAMAMRIASLLHLHKIKTPQESSSAIASVGFVEALKTCMKAPGLVLFIVFSAWMNFWMGFTGPFVPVFCFEELKVHTAEFTMLVTLGTLTGIAGWVFWGKTADRVGSVAVIIVGTILWELQQFLWVVLTPETAWLLYPMYLWGGFFAVSFFMGCFNLLLNLAPEKSSLAAVSLHLAVTSVAAALAPMLAGVLLEEFVTKRGGGLSTYHLGFLIKSVAFLLGLTFLAGIREPGKSSLTSLPGAFRSIRQQLAVQGLEFLANLTPFRSDRGSSKKRPRRK